MTVLETLRKSPNGWNHPTWPRRLVPICAGLGAVVASIGAELAGYDPAIAAGVGAGLAVPVAWLVLAAMD